MHLISHMVNYVRKHDVDAKPQCDGYPRESQGQLYEWDIEENVHHN